MHPSAIYMRLAQAWHAAAGDAANEELRACYATRAAEYFELAARERVQPSEPDALAEQGSHSNEHEILTSDTGLP